GAVSGTRNSWIAAGSGSGLVPPGAFGHPGRSGGTAGMETSREWATGLCGRFGWLTLTAPECFRLSLVLPAHADIPGRRGIRLGGAVVAHVVPFRLCRRPPGGNAVREALVDFGAGRNVPVCDDLGEETCRVAAAAGFPR